MKEHLYARIIVGRWDCPPLHIGFGPKAAEKPLEEYVNSNSEQEGLVPHVISVFNLYGYNMGEDRKVLEIDKKVYHRNLEGKFEELDPSTERANIKIPVDYSVRLALSGLDKFFR